MAAELAHLKACLLGSVGETDAALRMLEEASAAGVVVLTPALRELPAAASTALSPATVLIGSEDELLEVVEAADPQLSAFGLTVERLPGLGHEFPADFARDWPSSFGASGVSRARGA